MAKKTTALVSASIRNGFEELVVNLGVVFFFFGETKQADKQVNCQKLNEEMANFSS